MKSLYGLKFLQIKSHFGLVRMIFQLKLMQSKDSFQILDYEK